ncbi:MAG: energy transducer TonB [Candidatus Acidiferrales bacterium]
MTLGGRPALFIGSLILGCALSLGAMRSGVSAGERFVAPDITAAGDIPYPVEIVGAGLVTLSLNLSVAGQPPAVQVLRDVPGLTSLTSSIVAGWTYTPGKLDGNAAPSTINIEVVFNPGDFNGQNLKVPPVAPAPPPFPAGYLPAEVAVGSYASYPMNSVATGAVVLDVLVDKNGNAKKIGVVRDVPSLTREAIAAVKRWTINPATFNGKPIASKLVVAYVFRSPTVSTQ